MDKHPLTQVLNEYARKGVPDDLDLRNSIRLQLETSKNLSIQGDFYMKTGFAQQRRSAVLISATILIVAALWFLTPQGRAWAQNMLRFFSRATEESLPVPVVQPTLKNPTKILTTTAIPKATQPPESLPFQEACGNLNFARCSLEEIREMVDFPVGAPLALPEGWKFSGATGGPDQIWLNYHSDAGVLNLSQGPADFPDQIDWPVGTDAEIMIVEIGSVTGEYVQGAWVDRGDNKAAVAWDGSVPTRTLRWELEGIRYTIRYHPAKSITGIRLDQAMMVELASTLTVETAPQLPPASVPDLEEFVRQAGFEIREPGWIPERYVFKKATYTTHYNAVCLFYGYPESEMQPRLAVIQSPWLLGLETIKLPQQLFNKVPIDIPVHSEYVALGGAQYEQALYASNGLTIDALCNVENVPANHALIWQSGGKSYLISAALDAFDGREFLTRQEMHQIAESLTGVSTAPFERLDPGYLLTAEAANSQASFDVKAPTQMPADVHFAYAVYRGEEALAGPNTLADGSEEVILVYFGDTRDQLERRHHYLIFQNVVHPNTLDELILGGGEWVIVDGEKAVFYQTCWDDSASGGDVGCNVSLSWVGENSIRFDLNALLPGAVAPATVIAIAESMK